MSDNVLRKTLRPLAHLARSILGTNGLFENSKEIEAKLDALASHMARSQLPVQAARIEEPTTIPITKMESAAELLRDGFSYADLTGEPPPVLKPAVHGGGSRLCRQGDYATDAFRYWIGRTHWPIAMHRKLWEWFFIADALWSRGVLRPGSRGLGFGVGTEPLTALFAAHDCEITATDLDSESTQASQMGWIQTNQHASEIAALHYPLICPQEKLAEHVVFRPVDMNNIPANLNDFDFNWSACSLEHLGSLRHGIDFVIKAVECLRPGGIAVHTTEFNLSSNTNTFETEGLSLYRKCDIEDLISELEDRGHVVEPVDWNRGNGLADKYVDLPPFKAPMHLRLRLAEFDCTSIGLIVHAKA
jgi:Methyltransferase domain